MSNVQCPISKSENDVKARTVQYDLEQRLIDFAVIVIDIAEELPASRAGNHIASQLIRCGTSSAPNYGEAQSAESRNDFIHKMMIAFKELRETRVWLRLILRKPFVQNGRTVQAGMDECEQLLRIFWKSISTAKSGKGSR